MIIGIGVDIVEIKRVEKAVGKAAFLARVFSPRELELYKGRGENIDVLAGCFAGKEAVGKALGTGFRGFWPGDVEVLRDEIGKPYINLTGKAKKIAESQNVTNWHISITNATEYAAAFVVAEK